MKKFLLPVFLTLVLIFTSCSPFGEQEAFDKKVSIDIDGEPLALSVVYDDIYSLALEYDKDAFLVGVIVTFEGESQLSSQKGVANFTFAHTDDEATTATDISYKRRKRLKVSTEPMDESLLAASFESIFASFSEDPSFEKKLNGENIKLTVEFSSAGLTYTLI